MPFAVCTRALLRRKGVPGQDLHARPLGDLHDGRRADEDGAERRPRPLPHPPLLEKTGRRSAAANFAVAAAVGICFDAKHILTIGTRRYENSVNGSRCMDVENR